MKNAGGMRIILAQNISFLTNFFHGYELGGDLGEIFPITATGVQRMTSSSSSSQEFAFTKTDVDGIGLSVGNGLVVPVWAMIGVTKNLKAKTM